MRAPMRVYISGRIKDYPEHEGHFARAVSDVLGAGHTAVSPLDNGLGSEAAYEDHMRADFVMLLGCHAIFMLEGWERSAGARAEHAVACQCGMPIYYETFALLPTVLVHA